MTNPTPTLQTRLAAIREELERVIELGEKATAGPWEHKSEMAENIYAKTQFSEEKEQIAMLMWPSHPSEHTPLIEKIWYDTGAFIANSRTFNPKAARALLGLINEVEKGRHTQDCAARTEEGIDHYQCDCWLSDALLALVDQWETQ